MPSKTLASAVNLKLLEKTHVCKCKERQFRSMSHVCRGKERQLRSICLTCLRVQGTSSSPPTPPHQLRSMSHVCMCNEHHHTALTPPQPNHPVPCISRRTSTLKGCYTYVYKCICKCIHIFIYIYTYICICTFKLISVCIFAFIYIFICLCTYIYMYMHIVRFLHGNACNLSETLQWQKCPLWSACFAFWKFRRGMVVPTFSVSRQYMNML